MRIVFFGYKAAEFDIEGIRNSLPEALEVHVTIVNL
jgi:hypothetical protein